MSEDLPRGNFVSEWSGHRLFPAIIATDASLEDQASQRCPFLSSAKGESTQCIKTESAKGVCTINSSSNGPRQDWIVCPYRAIDPSLLRSVVGDLYDLAATDDPVLLAAPRLRKVGDQQLLTEAIRNGRRGFVYFDQKAGGEIGLSATDRSPEIAFDTTFVEIVAVGDDLMLDRFGIMEIQTMDFHGSYRHAVKDLSDALRLHGGEFPIALEKHPHWLSNRIEGPNIANVFKRTFYQLMFKFGIAETPQCAGCSLVIPEAVWDSWSKFLGAPELAEVGTGRHRLLAPDHAFDEDLRAFICVLHLDFDKRVTPSPARIRSVIQTSANAVAHFALEEAPKGAVDQIGVSLYDRIRRRLRAFCDLEFKVTPTP